MKFKHLAGITLALGCIAVAMGQAENILMTSAERGWTVLAAIGLVLGADVEATDLEGRTPLMVAASRNDASLAKLLISYGSDVNSQNPKGRTPLMFAAAGGHRKLVDQLIDSDANIKLKDKNRRSATWYAKKSGDEELLAHLKVQQYGEAPEPEKVVWDEPSSEATERTYDRRPTHDRRPMTHDGYKSDRERKAALRRQARHDMKRPGQEDDSPGFSRTKVRDARSPTLPTIR